MSMQQFNYKFGWGENSKVAGRYFLKRSLGKTRIREGMKRDEIQKYEVENTEMKEELLSIKEKNQTIEDKMSKIEDMLKKEKLITHLEKGHIHGLENKKTNKRSFFGYNPVSHSQYKQLIDKSLFHNEIQSWSEEIEKHVSVKETSKSLKIGADAILFYKMWNSFSKDIKQELARGNVHTLEDFEQLMLHLITHGSILDYRVNKEIEEEINS